MQTIASLLLLISIEKPLIVWKEVLVILLSGILFIRRKDGSGRKRLEGKETDKAEQAFSEAISSFKKVSDHNNNILINCNLGHVRRATFEEIVSQMDHLRNHPVFSNACNHKLEAAK
ncbi:hypothetical protein Tco_1261673 [Tanacetum coccineum]